MHPNYTSLHLFWDSIIYRFTTIEYSGYIRKSSTHIFAFLVLLALAGRLRKCKRFFFFFFRLWVLKGVIVRGIRSIDRGNWG